MCFTLKVAVTFFCLIYLTISFPIEEESIDSREEIIDDDDEPIQNKIKVLESFQKTGEEDFVFK